jgi:hypothetical protein
VWTGCDYAPNLAEPHGDELAVVKRADPDSSRQPFRKIGSMRWSLTDKSIVMSGY